MAQNTKKFTIFFYCVFILSIPVFSGYVEDQKNDMALIPAGEFQMGSEEDDEKPIHTVYLDAFYIDKYEVTNAQYRLFVEATGHREPEGYGYIDGKWVDGFKPWQDSNFNGDKHPVVCVSWEDAKAYCHWAGKRLPTEAEWEKAARVGLLGKKYPWGDERAPGELVGNFSDKTTETAFVSRNYIPSYNDGYIYTSPVGSFKPNGYGLYDMAGNVWECCSDWYDKNYYSNSPIKNPKGADSGVYRVLRGGSWFSLLGRDLTLSYRYFYLPTNRIALVGFRCVDQD